MESRNREFSMFRLKLFLLAIAWFGAETESYICNVPDAWFNAFNGSRAHRANGTLWPNGIVPYKLHSSLRNHDRITTWKAFTEYEKKTCIRFQPWREGEQDFTEVMLDHSVCGLASLCRQGGGQYTKIGTLDGEECRSVSTMIHELGHTLCLFHEQQRVDRDDYLTFQDCKDEDIIPKLDFGQNQSSLGIYDFGSQMHYQCGWCKGGWPRVPGVSKCGVDVTTGLSVLDADNLNRMYKCQGCFRHRWQKVDQLTVQDSRTLYSFGFKNRYGALYPCRALVNGAIAVGGYSRRRKSCIVSHHGQEFEFKRDAEVLTIANGKTQRGSTYALVERKKASAVTLLSNAIPAGRFSEMEGASTTFIAFATIRKGFLQTEDSIGMVATIEGQFTSAQFSVGDKVYVTDKYFILTCA